MTHDLVLADQPPVTPEMERAFRLSYGAQEVSIILCQANVRSALRALEENPLAKGIVCLLTPEFVGKLTFFAQMRKAMRCNAKVFGVVPGASSDDSRAAYARLKSLGIDQPLFVPRGGFNIATHTIAKSLGFSTSGDRVSLSEGFRSRGATEAVNFCGEIAWLPPRLATILGYFIERPGVYITRYDVAEIAGLEPEDKVVSTLIPDLRKYLREQGLIRAEKTIVIIKRTSTYIFLPDLQYES